MQRGKIVCRNTIESFVNKQDWTLNGKIFEFTFEWFERFSELYNIYPVKGVSIREGFSFRFYHIYPPILSISRDYFESFIKEVK